MVLKRWSRKLWRSRKSIRKVAERRDHLSRLPTELLLLIFRSANNPALTNPLSRHLLPIAITMRQETLVINPSTFLEPLAVKRRILPRRLALKRIYVNLPGQRDYKEYYKDQTDAIDLFLEVLYLAPFLTHITFHAPKDGKRRPEENMPEGYNFRADFQLINLEELDLVFSKAAWGWLASRKPEAEYIGGVLCTIRRQR